jgi:hypothetical protein
MKSITNKYYKILGKSLNDIKISEVTELVFSTPHQNASDVMSLYSLAIQLNNPELMQMVINEHKIKNDENIKKLMREVLREYRKTLSVPKESLSLMLKHYHNALEDLCDALTEIYGHNFLTNTMTYSSTMLKQREFLVYLSEQCNDINFPIKHKGISEIKDCFSISKENSDALDILNTVHSELREVELCVYLLLKKSEGLSFSDVLCLNDNEVIKDKSYLLCIIYVFYKEPYDLLAAKSEWVRISAMDLISSK